MTVYNCEQDRLRAQVHSNTEAIRYLKEKLEMVYPTKPEVVMLGRGSYDNAPGESVV